MTHERAPELRAVVLALGDLLLHEIEPVGALAVQLGEQFPVRFLQPPHGHGHEEGRQSGRGQFVPDVRRWHTWLRGRW